jgi:hypothetical protein
MPEIFHCVGGSCSGACLDAIRATALETDFLSISGQFQLCSIREAKYPDHGSTIFFICWSFCNDVVFATRRVSVKVQERTPSSVAGIGLGQSQAGMLITVHGVISRPHSPLSTIYQTIQSMICTTRDSSYNFLMCHMVVVNLVIKSLHYEGAHIF